MALAEVPEPKPDVKGEKGRFVPSGPLGPTDKPDGATKRVARIARDASGDVKDLFRAGLISDRDAAALSPAKKTPEQAVAIHAAEEAAKAVVRDVKPGNLSPARCHRHRRSVTRAGGPVTPIRVRITEENALSVTVTRCHPGFRNSVRKCNCAKLSCVHMEMPGDTW